MPINAAVFGAVGRDERYEAADVAAFASWSQGAISLSARGR